ncbi:AsmA family protein [Ideonella sp.]|uniref:AsmA family protein n=1 Tax=Ideonella sp. TaxID=1929293 RepID=UPI002B475CE8|nr:AsmA family protein [Ideonella sp.]HJV69005.1 AsmA family protein [Ideonella sp.]
MPPLARRLLWPLGALALLLAAFGIGEASGWRFLAGPAERWAGRHLDREVHFGGSAGRAGDPGFRLSLLGHVRLRLAELRVANPAWSQLGPMVQARQVELRLRWRDLMAARDGQPLTLQWLQADGLELQIERHADGRASWQFGRRTAAETGAAPAINGVHFETLQVRDGRLTLRDAPTALRLDGQFGYLPDAWQGQQPGWVGEARGAYGPWPVELKLRTGSVLPEVASLQASEVPVVLTGGAGTARLSFDGMVHDLLGQPRFKGRYVLGGPSLAAVGEPLGITLPTTPPFTMQGEIERDGPRWATRVQSARIGRSQLAGEFEFRRPAGALPSLSGELRGPVLWLQDLGPAIGTRAKPTLGTPALPPPAHAPERVLPDRPLDLPSLSVMQADVRIRLDRLELGHPRLQSAQPLRAHLTLNDGVLTIEDLDATLARGRLWGRVQLDGRQPRALWNVDLSASGLRLEQWIAQQRPAGQPPYVTGELAGRFQLQGRGRSVAELLGASNGNAHLLWSDGTVSHLAIEAAGIDIAEVLGLMLRGDDTLPVRCGAADLAVRAGQVEPRLLVVDTPDSTVWGSGSVSLADERLDLLARVAPKDMSPLALRTPLRVRGTLSDPRVSLDKGPLARRAVPAVLLGLLNPLAALLPLVDTGSREAAEQHLAGCHRLVAERAKTRR